MNLHDIVPECRVNLDYGGFFYANGIKNHGILNIPFVEGNLNIAASLIGTMADTITVYDDGVCPVQKRIEIAKEIAPLAERVIIIKGRGELPYVRTEVRDACTREAYTGSAYTGSAYTGSAYTGSAYTVCIDRSQRQRKVYVC